MALMSACTLPGTVRSTLRAAVIAKAVRGRMPFCARVEESPDGNPCLWFFRNVANLPQRVTRMASSTEVG